MSTYVYVMFTYVYVMCTCVYVMCTCVYVMCTSVIDKKTLRVSGCLFGNCHTAPVSPGLLHDRIFFLDATVLIESCVVWLELWRSLCTVAGIV